MIMTITIHDSFEDYVDLLSNETEASDYEESLIERTIEKD